MSTGNPRLAEPRLGLNYTAASQLVEVGKAAPQQTSTYNLLLFRCKNVTNWLKPFDVARDARDKLIGGQD